MSKSSLLLVAGVLLAGCRPTSHHEVPAESPIFPIAGMSGCFARGTPIATPSGDVPIEQIRIGDSVLSYDFDTGSVVSAVVTDSIAHGPEPVIELEAPDGSALRVTPNHPVYLVGSGRFEPAGQIGQASESLVLTSLASAAPQSVRIRPTAAGERVAVYDLSVDGLHNYFAAGVLVHNKSRCWPDASGCMICAGETTAKCPYQTAGWRGPPINVPPGNPGPAVNPTPPPNPQARTQPIDPDDAGSDAG